jgi:preprotein translocase subunit SecD
MRLQKNILALVLVSFGAPGALAADAPAIFQVRRVENAPAADLEQMPYTSPDGQTMMLSVQKSAVLGIADVESASVAAGDGPGGEPELRVWLTPKGRERFAAVTAQSIHQQFAVVIDGKVYAAPVMQARLAGSYLPVLVHVTGRQARELAAKINAAAKQQ